MANRHGKRQINDEQDILIYQNQDQNASDPAVYLSAIYDAPALLLKEACSVHRIEMPLIQGLEKCFDIAFMVRVVYAAAAPVPAIASKASFGMAFYCFLNYMNSLIPYEIQGLVTMNFHFHVHEQGQGSLLVSLLLHSSMIEENHFGFSYHIVNNDKVLEAEMSKMPCLRWNNNCVSDQ
ncbi:hypothetical protein IEQ34_026546 [Dendrobium chrysotoxum]|uniref:Uncharacterized protein n=1 Tax=Dendrobium chrysotoxum TaxID=161865 RepID=A0AAV7FM44_DENCH|nr:hypothetical protein IEQ34_026546 [Dendrobium chrysotoxum]